MHVTHTYSLVQHASIALTEPAAMAKRTPQAKRVRFEEGTPRRSEGRARRKLQLVAFRKYLPVTFYAPGEGFSHETRYQTEHDSAEVCKSETGREPASVRTPLKACTPIKLPPENL